MAEFQSIKCEDHGAFLMSFSVDVNGQGHTPSTGIYAAGQSATIDLADPHLPQPVAPGTTVAPSVVAVPGVVRQGPPVVYQPNGLTAVYDVTGTLFDVEVKLDGVGAPARPMVAAGPSHTFTGISPDVFACVKATSSREHGTVYDPPSANQGTATTHYKVLWWTYLIVLSFDFQPAAGTLTYTVQQITGPATPGEVWNGIGATISGCQRTDACALAGAGSGAEAVR